MRTTHITAVALISVFLALSSHAQLTRTWVSGVGDDANPGSRTAPGKTFAGMINITAIGGVIDVLDPGGFGAVTISNSITIEGDAAEGGILVSGGNAIVINAGASAVVILRNLTLEGLGTSLSGIQIVSAGAVHIENCRINGFTGSGIDFVSGVSNAQLFVKNTTIHNCTPSGINLAPTMPSTILIEGASVTGCSNGIVAASNTVSVVTDTTASGNAGVGFLVGTNAHMTINRGTSTDNTMGLQSSGLVVLSASTIADNAADGLKIIKPGIIRSYHNNYVFGNAPDGHTTSMLTYK